MCGEQHRGAALEVARETDETGGTMAAVGELGRSREAGKSQASRLGQWGAIFIVVLKLLLLHKLWVLYKELMHGKTLITGGGHLANGVFIVIFIIFWSYIEICVWLAARFRGYYCILAGGVVSLSMHRMLCNSLL